MATRQCNEVTAEEVESFLAGAGRLTNYWHTKHCTLDRFYRYAISRSYIRESPLPKVMPQRPPKLVPYIYSRDEIRRLLSATDEYQILRSVMEPITVRILILLLYGTGLRIGEAKALNREDVNLDESLLTVRETKFFKSRLVPISTELTSNLGEYIGRDTAKSFASTLTSPFLTKRDGTRLRATINSVFRRVRSQAGIRRSDGGRSQPRLHDLRHTFAVHRLTQWYREGADVQKLLPMLSVYLGHRNLASTQVYLSMTPELLQEASTCFEAYAFAEVSNV